jgi:hypothetical protein
MKRFMASLALALFAAAPATAQATTAHDHHATAAAPCPLHLKTLDLSPSQAAAFDSIRAAHKEVMKTLMPEHDMKAGKHDMKMTDSAKARMKETMALAVTAARLRLTEPQIVIFDTAVAAHADQVKNAASKAEGCMACCTACMGHDHFALARE